MTNSVHKSNQGYCRLHCCLYLKLHTLILCSAMTRFLFCRELPKYWDNTLLDVTKPSALKWQIFKIESNNSKLLGPWKEPTESCSVWIHTRVSSSTNDDIRLAPPVKLKNGHGGLLRIHVEEGGWVTTKQTLGRHCKDCPNLFIQLFQAALTDMRFYDLDERRKRETFRIPLKRSR